VPALRLVMMGTGEFALPTFLSLYNTAHQVVALYTQPDRTGRGHHQGHVNPMKELALSRGTPVFQPQNVNLPGELETLRGLAADVLVVAAYGQLLSPQLLEIPPLGSINVHASLLPRHRGASPVAHAILCGDAETGISIIQILPRLDAGPILAVGRTPIGPRETAGELEERLSHIAVPLVGGVLDQLASGTVEAVPQSDSQVTRAPKLTREMGIIDWNRPARDIDRQVRAMQPWPRASTVVHAAGRPPQRLIVLAVRADPSDQEASAPPGTVLRVDQRGVVIQTGEGTLALSTVQPEGKRPMSAADYLRGNPLSPGDRCSGSAH
jgi:methionyl-tRNA formyltransferase